MHIEPLSDVVVIRRQTQQEVSRGGIYLPLSDDFREDIGTVVFAGKGKLSPKGVRIPMEVKAGDEGSFLHQWAPDHDCQRGRACCDFARIRLSESLKAMTFIHFPQNKKEANAEGQCVLLSPKSKWMAAGYDCQRGRSDLSRLGIDHR
jgi:co-chaperonin GroES (HSP10)